MAEGRREWTEADLIDAIMEAQADLQSVLGRVRLQGWQDREEDRLMRSLAWLHAALDVLGRPMYDPATHPDVTLAEVGVSPEEEEDGRVVGWTQEEYTPALGRLHAAYLTLKDENQRLRAGGLSREEIEALLVAAALVRGLDTREGSPETWLLDSARAKLRAYLGQQNDV